MSNCCMDGLVPASHRVTWVFFTRSVLPAYEGVIYPEAEQSGMVVTQLTRFVDEWDSWREDEQEDEENLFMRFVLSERTDNPEVLLQ